VGSCKDGYIQLHATSATSWGQQAAAAKAVVIAALC